MNSAAKFLFVVFIAVLIRWLVSTHPHSGQGKPPMYGDFEAQRHWMELTNHLPVKHWYRNTTDNDLLYWGLDYPVLTAYHSFLMGKMFVLGVACEIYKLLLQFPSNPFSGQLFNSSWMQLHKSRGMEYYEFKIFMRSTVIVSDLLIFMPAAFFLLKICQGMYFPKRSKSENQLDDLPLVFCIILLCPPLILIDHGHFQYNCVSLGLALGAFAFFVASRDEEPEEMALPDVFVCIGAILFVFSLCYKQMQLYHALPVFFFLFGKCIHQKRVLSGVILFASLGLTVILTFITVLLPFLMPTPQPAFDVAARMFPVNRGLYEDKVASFWCALSAVWKFQSVVSVSHQLLACSLGCLIAFLPAAFVLLKRPRRKSLLPAVVVGSLSFFLFSYHVHEKSILLAIVPACFLLEVLPLEIIWFSFVAALSMLPLLIKDGLVTAFFGLETIWIAVIIVYFATRKRDTVPGDRFLPEFYLDMRNSMMTISIIGGVVVSMLLLSNYPAPPARLPYLYSLLVALYSCAHFFFFLIIFYFLLIGYANVESSSKLQKKVR